MPRAECQRAAEWLTHMQVEADKVAHVDGDPDGTRRRYANMIALLTDEAELHRLIGANVIKVLANFGWDHAVLRADVESDRLAETVEGCVLMTIERAMRGQVER